MFNSEFYPTPLEVIEKMMEGEIVNNKICLEPSAGKGDIVDFLVDAGAKNILACENNQDLKKILQTKCKLIESDFFDLTSEKVSHVDFIIMNPPFSTAEKHILHAYQIAPPECKIIALCNAETVNNDFSKSRKELKSIISTTGSFIELGDCFTEAERKTGVNVGLIKLIKAGKSYQSEFQGFFMEEEPQEMGENGIMSYNVVRDLVNRYVAAVKLYDKQLETGKQMNDLLSNFYGESLTFTCTERGAVKLRDEFKKDLQKAGWKFIFAKMDLRKNTTRGLMEDINKFVEQQSEIPFTMRNIYHMLDMVVQTTGQRMDKAILEVFDRVTEHHHDNRHNVKGWKTNLHFLVGKKFILPNMISPAKEYGFESGSYRSLKQSYDGTMPDFEKALCFVTGEKYAEIEYKDGQKIETGINTINHSINNNTYGEWYNSHFFKYKGYKNGNMHFEFISEDVWRKFNSIVAKLKGYPLYEAKEQTAYQQRQAGRKQGKQEKKTASHSFTILKTIKIPTS